MFFGLFLLAVGLFIYVRIIRPWQVRWGATDAEVARTLPGDEVVTHPSFNATRAITIQARPEAVWPWLLQIGSNRAGWYSLDWIDNNGVPSSEYLIPELQHMTTGDFVPMTPDGKNGMWVKACEPNQWMLWWDKKGTSTWLWWFEPEGTDSTRLITRLRVRYTWTSVWVIYYLLQDVGDIVMMSRCMRGIKRRAEQTRQSALAHENV